LCCAAVARQHTAGGCDLIRSGMVSSLKHTSLSCVHYQDEDDMGKLLAYIALGPIFIVVFQFSKVYTRREVHEAMLLIGLGLEEALARTLKDLLKHPRPRHL